MNEITKAVLLAIVDLRACELPQLYDQLESEGLRINSEVMSESLSDLHRWGHVRFTMYRHHMMDIEPTEYGIICARSIRGFIGTVNG